MSIPEKLPIKRIEDYHTHYLGKTSDGKQFWGYETFVFSKPFGQISGDDWRKYRKEYVVLHTFDQNGNYLNTNHWYAGTAIETDISLMTQKLEEMISELGNVEYCDVEVKLFQTTIDNVIFGLVPNSDYEAVDLEPSSTISFQEPWDGEYYT